MGIPVPLSATATRVGPLAFVLFALAAPAAAAEAVDVALITAVQGNVARATPNGPQAVPAFVKLKRGDRVTLANGRVQLVYFDSGRQEIWRGDGRIEIGNGASKGSGLPEPETRTLPDIMVKQIAKTPSLESQGRAGAVRLRSLTSPAVLEKLEETYRQLRQWAEANDINPELFLLSALYELRELNRVDQVLTDLAKTRPNDADAEQVESLYRKLLKDALDQSK